MLLLLSANVGYCSAENDFKDSTQIIRVLKTLTETVVLTDLYTIEQSDEFRRLVFVKHPKKLAALIANTLNDAGESHRNLGNYQKALFFHKLALKVSQTNDDHFSEATTLNNIGVVYRRIDAYDEAMRYHLLALKINDSIGNKHGSAISLNSIGNITYTMGRLDEALSYFTQSLDIEINVGSKLGIAINYNNIGNVYKDRKMYETALEFYRKSFEMNNQIKSKKGIGICLNDIGSVYSLQGDNKQALDHFTKALMLFDEAGDKRYIADAAFNAGSEYFKIKNFNKAILFIDSSLSIARSINAKSQIYMCLAELSGINKSIGNFEKALAYYEEASVYHDSIFNENSQRQISNLQTVYETHKKEQEINALKNQGQISKLMIKRQELIFSFSLLIVIIVGVGIYVAYRNKKKSEQILFDKNQLIERAGAELRRYAQELEIERDRAQASERSKTDFLANMSHEIRTPLNSVLGFADLLETRLEDTALKNYLHAIKINGRNLLVLINDILDISKIEAGKMELKFDFVDLHLMLTELAELYAIQATEKGLVLKTEIDAALPAAILLDEARFRQVLYNLLSNALKYTEIGEITISAGLTKTHTLADENNEHAESLYISVADTGIGIKNEDLDCIFEAFNQGNFQKKLHVGGTGLGLTISKHIIEKLGGTISVESTYGKGSIFTIRFYNMVSRDCLSLSSSGTSKTETPDYTGYRILVVDDLSVNRDLLIGILEETNAVLLQASNGKEAIDILMMQSVDIILMDIRMPVMDGFEAAMYIRAQKPWENIPIIAVTASVMGNDFDRITEMKFEGYIMKPIQMWELYEILNKYLLHTNKPEDENRPA